MYTSCTGDVWADLESTSSNLYTYTYICVDANTNGFQKKERHSLGTGGYGRANHGDNFDARAVLLRTALSVWDELVLNLCVKIGAGADAGEGGVVRGACRVRGVSHTASSSPAVKSTSGPDQKQGKTRGVMARTSAIARVEG